jgi:hypothetical protein
LSVQQVVLISYAGSACLGGIGLLVMSVPERLALLLSGVTIILMGFVAVGLTRVKVAAGGTVLSSPSLGSGSVERTLPS